ncbi:hypothetical protein HZA43_04900 [Candidatus Peregrinibacteria bacterium]|nr:hypothetical protein [Candidatus Peregrinibacteria bacterium]
MNKKIIIAGVVVLLALDGFLKRDFFLRFLPKGGLNSHALTIVLNTEAADLSPYSLNLNDRTRTANIYEGLMAFDPSLKIIPSLATTWGNIDARTWEFKLRRGVLFQDGQSFVAEDVTRSFDEAKTKGGGEIKSLLATIREIKIIDPQTIRVITREPDPLLLSKLTAFMITRPGNTGTGPYKLAAMTQSGTGISLTAFQDYWGPLPTFKNVLYAVTETQGARQADFYQGKTDILAAVPRDQAIHMENVKTMQMGDPIRRSYSLEVSFLLFNLKNELLKDRALREKIQSLLDPKKIEAIGNRFVRRVSQFVAPGVFGYNDRIALVPFDPAKKTVDIFSGKRKKIALDYSETYETLAQYLNSELRQAGFSVTLNSLPADALLQRLKDNASDLYLIGWQAENGDAGDFLNAFIHSDGAFNGGRYANPAVDKLIEQSRVEIDPKKRLTLLQSIMQKLNDDLIGLPLFESTRLYAVRPDVMWKPRLDGLVLAKEVK